MLQRNKMIIFESITYAYKARDFLNKNGMNTNVQRVPTQLKRTGCGFGVRINSSRFDDAIELLDKHNFKVKDVINL